MILNDAIFLRSRLIQKQVRELKKDKFKNILVASNVPTGEPNERVSLCSRCGCSVFLIDDTGKIEIAETICTNCYAKDETKEFEIKVMRGTAKKLNERFGLNLTHSDLKEIALKLKKDRESS